MNWMDDQPPHDPSVAVKDRRHANPWRFIPVICVGIIIWAAIFTSLLCWMDLR